MRQPWSLLTFLDDPCSGSIPAGSDGGGGVASTHDQTSFDMNSANKLKLGLFGAQLALVWASGHDRAPALVRNLE